MNRYKGENGHDSTEPWRVSRMHAWRARHCSLAGWALLPFLEESCLTGGVCLSQPLTGGWGVGGLKFSFNSPFSLQTTLYSALLVYHGIRIKAFPSQRAVHSGIFRSAQRGPGGTVSGRGPVLPALTPRAGPGAAVILCRRCACFGRLALGQPAASALTAEARRK